MNISPTTTEMVRCCGAVDGHIVSVSPVTPAGMGLEDGKVSLLAADLGEGSDRGPNGGLADNVSAGIDVYSVDYEPFNQARHTIRHTETPNAAVSTQGGRGSDSVRVSEGVDGFERAENFRIGKAELRAAVADKRRCPVCALDVCPAGWAQCWGETECPSHWDHLDLKK